MEIAQLLKFAHEQKASDIHISASLPPMLRIDGILKKLDADPLTDEQVTNLIHSIMANDQIALLKKNLETDFSFEVEGLSRFRVNAFTQNRGLSAVFRIIPRQIPSLEDLALPETFKDFCTMTKGLVLVTGPTGSGKSSTLAAMIDYINNTSNKHIITIEDPIEFVHDSKKCLINQREVHRDTKSFNAALRSALREDPDIILVGEMRDLETIRLALSASETGHLVFGTLHTTSAIQTINRIIDVFPGNEQNLVRSMLSESLNCVISQTLIPKTSGGRVVALEVMRQTHAINNLIRENKIAQMYSAIQSGVELGMHTLDQYLQKLAKQGIISDETAELVAVNKESFMNGVN